MITKSFPASFSVPLALALFVAAQCSIPAARAAGYLEFEGIPGEATAPGFENWIEIDSVEFGARGGGANPVFTHIVLSKRPDQASPLLFLASDLGSQREAKIRFTNLTSSGNRRVYLEITLNDVYVSSMSTTGSSLDDFSEEVSLTFRESEIEYIPDEGNPIRVNYKPRPNT